MADQISVLPGLPLPLPTPGGNAVLPDSTSGAAPPSVPPPQPNWATRAAVLQSEYVSGGGYQFLAQYIRSLPHWIDDATRDFGDDLYERMLTDPQVSSAIRVLKESTLSSGIRLEPAIQKESAEQTYDDFALTENLPARDLGGRFKPKYANDDEKAQAEKQDAEDAKLTEEAELAEEITDFCEQNLLHLDRPFIETLYEMLDGIALGNQVAEQVYEIRNDPDQPPRIWLRALKVKPRKATAFVLDPFMNIVGILGMIPGQAYPVLTGSVVADPSQIPNMLHRTKFAIFTWGSKNNDPRGSSLLRVVYNPWFLKMNAWAEYAKYLVKFASPSLVGYTAPGAQPVRPTDALGNVIPGGGLTNPETAMLNALLNFTNGTVVVFPAGSKVDPLIMSGDGAAYRNAIALFDQQITKGILCQTLATDEASHMALAASQTHQDVLDTVVLHIKNLMASMIYQDILYHLVRYNWGDDIARRLTPRAQLSQIQQHNWAKDASAIAALMSSQYLDHSQLPEMDARLGLPKRAAPPPGTIPGAPAGPAGPIPKMPMPGAAQPPRMPMPTARPPFSQIGMSADDGQPIVRVIGKTRYKTASWYRGPIKNTNQHRHAIAG